MSSTRARWRPLISVAATAPNLLSRMAGSGIIEVSKILVPTSASRATASICTRWSAPSARSADGHRLLRPRLPPERRRASSSCERSGAIGRLITFLGNLGYNPRLRQFGRQPSLWRKGCLLAVEKFLPSRACPGCVDAIEVCCGHRLLFEPLQREIFRHCSGLSGSDRELQFRSIRPCLCRPVHDRPRNNADSLLCRTAPMLLLPTARSGQRLRQACQ